MSNCLKLGDVIRRLQELARQHGVDQQVIITGLYASHAEIDTAEDIRYVKDDRTSYIQISTDLCTG